MWPSGNVENDSMAALAQAGRYCYRLIFQDPPMRGSIGAARSASPNSANSQFFINFG
jgi:cyclophilin family peptidyl-prolyl cis-trans isomerase